MHQCLGMVRVEIDDFAIAIGSSPRIAVRIMDKPQQVISGRRWSMLGKMRLTRVSGFCQTPGIGQSAGHLKIDWEAVSCRGV